MHYEHCQHKIDITKAFKIYCTSVNINILFYQFDADVTTQEEFSTRIALLAVVPQKASLRLVRKKTARKTYNIRTKLFDCKSSLRNKGIMVNSLFVLHQILINCMVTNTVMLMLVFTKNVFMPNNTQFRFIYSLILQNEFFEIYC